MFIPRRPGEGSLRPGLPRGPGSRRIPTLGGSMARLKRRVVAVAVMVITACTPLTFALAPSTAYAAGNVFNFDYNVDASTHLKTLNQTVNVPGGRFFGG